MNKIVLASNNQGKVKEFKEIFKGKNVKIISLADAGINVDIQETGKTFEENAYIKANEIYKLTGLPTIADDSGLMVDYLNGEPGVMSARYAGNNVTDDQNIEKLLNKMKNAKVEERKAKFVCSIVFIIPLFGKELQKPQIIKVTGECIGKIGFERRGNNGFGYDSIFLVKEKTFAELSMDEKNKISHRGKALKALKTKIEEWVN